MTDLRDRIAEERLWLAETMAGALEVVCRCPDVDDILRFWARTIARRLEPIRVALFVIEGERWLRILPDGQSAPATLVAEETLGNVLVGLGPVKVDPAAPGDPMKILVPYAARDGWRGVLLLWLEEGAFSTSQYLQAGEIAGAISRCLSVLKKSEMSRDQSIASERSRWAAELHDGHLQSLSSAKLHSEFCASLEREHGQHCQSPMPSARLGFELARLDDLLADMVREARQFVLELRAPPVSADQFLPWLRAYTEDFSRENGIRVEMRIEGEGELPQNQVEEATCLVREALTNVRKHAKAGRVSITVTFSERNASISVSDDGVGFDVRATMERLLDSSHNGLIGVRYRAESIGGEMRLKSEVGKGTTILFRLPRAARRGSSESGSSRRSTGERIAPVRTPGVETSRQRDTSVRDSIRAALAEAIDSFLEQETGARANKPGDGD